MHGVGGMVSFRDKLTSGLQKRGVEVSEDPEDDCDALLVIAGTRDLGPLRRARKRGVRVVHRLDGINWLHRKHRTPLRVFAARRGRQPAAGLHPPLSRRPGGLPERVHPAAGGRTGTGGPVCQARSFTTALTWSVYSPSGPGERPKDLVRIMVVEGSLVHGHEVGLSWAVELAEKLKEIQPLPVELVVAAEVAESQKEYWKTHSRRAGEFSRRCARASASPNWTARRIFIFRPRSTRPARTRSSRRWPAGCRWRASRWARSPSWSHPRRGWSCPTAATPGSSSTPDIPGLAAAAVQMLTDLPRYQAGARARAEFAFGLDAMVEKYLDVLLG